MSDEFEKVDLAPYIEEIDTFIQQHARALAAAMDAQIAELLASVPEPKFLLLNPRQPAPFTTMKIVRSALIPMGVGYEVDPHILDFKGGIQ